MIAVDFVDWDAPRNTPEYLVRSGILLSITKGHLTHEHIAYVITPRMRHDNCSSLIKDGEKIILAVTTNKIKVKGVNIPFEP